MSRLLPMLLPTAAAAGEFAVAGPSASSTLPLILHGTDMSGDADDAGALAVLHARADLGECRLLATLVHRNGHANSSDAARLAHGPASHSVRRAYELRHSEGRPSIRGAQPSWDQTAVLFAVRGPDLAL